MYRLKIAVSRLPFDPQTPGLQRLPGVYEVICALSDGLPISTRVMTHPGWWQMTAKTGVVEMPTGSPQMQGRTIWLTGYDIGESRVEFFNETGWGKEGYGTVSFGYLDRFANSYVAHAQS